MISRSSGPRPPFYLQIDTKRLSSQETTGGTVRSQQNRQTDMLPSTALTLCTLLTCSALAQCTVFLDQSSAGQVLRSTSRRRRANSLFLEEMLPGNLERECYEESCSQEEAAEIFQTREKTLEFWYKYTNLNPCRTNPCLNGGICTMDRGDFMCLCPPQYHGKTCDSEVLECRYRNGGCMQYCRDLLDGAGVQCGCADGFKLETDGHCSPTGDLDKMRPDPGEQLIKIQKVIVHPHFHSFTFDSDIALLYLAQPVVRGPTAVPACLPDPHLSRYLLQDGNRGVVTGWGLTRYLGRSSRFLRKVTLPVVRYRDCTASTEQVITDNMFCAGYLDVSIDACSGDSGGPFVVNYRGTWFLTGVVSWGEKCAAKGKYGVYARLGNFLNWIRDTMERTDINETES
uniref:vitamin K-dependent protein C isoform X3 n=1 Tax=Scatophagus argus TaxID=75038 RepID=UPI001ED819A3|nr:vitamin K-dependent protein C isoform X3 [Scatophagus argus]